MFFSPMEQYIINPIFSLDLTINNIIFYFMLAGFISILMAKGIANGKLVTNNWGILSESLMRTILLMIENTVNIKYGIYLPLLYSMFYLVLFSNFLGLIPYSTTSTAEFVVTLSLSFTLLMGILLMGFLTHKLYLLAIFLPSGLPVGLVPILVALELLAFIFRIISLGLRLAINMITGHILLKVLMSFVWKGYLSGTSYFVLAIPLIAITAFVALEILIAYLQAYIFTYIIIITLNDCAMA